MLLVPGAGVTEPGRLCLFFTVGVGVGVGAGEKVSKYLAIGTTGTLSVTWPAFWKVMVTRTAFAPVSGRVRLLRVAFGAGPVSKIARLVGTLTVPPCSVTDFAALPAEMLISRSGVPVLKIAKNSPADCPAFSCPPIAGPRTNMFLTTMSPKVADAPSVG